VSPVRYELGFYIPEDGISLPPPCSVSHYHGPLSHSLSVSLHSHRREGLKYYINCCCCDLDVTSGCYRKVPESVYYTEISSLASV
jgi:hypothetical protein